MRWHEMDGSDWAWMMVMMGVFWAGVVALVVVLLRRPTATTHDLESPEDALRRRLARGDIDLDEYRQLLETLRKP